MDRADSPPSTDGFLARQRDAFVAALAARDPGRAAAVYARDARVLLPRGECMSGRAAIEAFWRVGLEAGMAGLALVPSEVVVEPSFACETGRYVMRMTPPHEAATEQRGRYLTVLRRHDAGSWLRTLEIFEPDREPDAA